MENRQARSKLTEETRAARDDVVRLSEPANQNELRRRARAAEREIEKQIAKRRKLQREKKPKDKKCYE